MKENENIEVTTEQQQGHDYFLYFSYIVLIAVIIFLFQIGAYAFIHNMDFTQIKHYFYAFLFALTIFFIFYNILAILGLLVFYGLFQFALGILEGTNF